MDGTAATYRAKHPYNPRHSDELPLSVGDIVSDVTDAESGWVLAHNRSTGETGLCPWDYLEQRSARRSRVDRFKNRVSTIYVNLTHNPKLFDESPGIQTSNLPLSTNPDSTKKTKKYILPQSHTRSQRITRCLTGILVGFLFGATTMAALSLSYGFTFIISASVSGAVTLIMSVFLIISPHARCVAAMMSVSVFTNQGRAAFLSLIPGILFAGPVINMQSNINQAANSAACIAEVVLNQSLAIHHQLLEPVAKQQKNLEVAAKIIEEKTVEIKSSFQFFQSVVDDVSDSSDVPSTSQGCTRVLSDLHASCLEQFERNTNSCRDAVKRNKYNNRLNPPDDNTLIRRRRFSYGSRCTKSVCETTDPRTTCDFLKNSDICKISGRAVSNTVENVSRSINDIDGILSFRLNSSSVIDIRGNTSIDPVVQVRKFKEHLQVDINNAIYIFSIINKVLFIFIIIAFIDACRYLRKYLHKNHFDNIYITGQLKYVDKQLRDDKEKAVLPLRKEEKKIYIDSTSVRLSAVEKTSMKMGLTLVVMYLLLSAAVILLDFALFYLLKVLADNGDIDFLVTGGVWLDVSVEGNGSMAEIFRAVVEGIKVSKEFEDVLNFKQCLPEASSPDWTIVYSVIVLCSMIVIFVLFKAYGLRLRRKITAFFFPEREAERVHYLYRHILLMRRVRAEEREKINLLTDKWGLFLGSSQDTGQTTKC